MASISPLRCTWCTSLPVSKLSPCMIVFDCKMEQVQALREKYSHNRKQPLKKLLSLFKNEYTYNNYADKQLMVLVLLFDLSENTTTRVIQNLALEAHTIARPGTTMPSGPLDFSPISRHLRTTPLVQYTGSLTTPPCLEGVTFVLAPNRLPVDVRSYNAIKRVLKYNSRVIQQQPGTGNALNVACH